MEDDADLQAIRNKRMAELQQQMGGMPPGGGKGGPSAEDRERMMREEREAKNTILSQILDQSARARLNNIALTKPDKAKSMESMLIQMARTGQIQTKLSEEQFKSLLTRLSEQTNKTSTVKFDRRRAALDSDSDDDL